MRLAAVVLAAGAGRRLGGVAKALLRRADGQSFLEAVASAAREAGAEEVVVVAGPPHLAATEAEATRLRLAVVVNPAPERGMASSVALGFADLARRCPDAAAALLWPVDHARVAAATVRRLVERAGADVIVVPVHGGRGGHPALFGRATWPELAACADAADGARSVVRRAPARVVRVDVADPGVVEDVDLPGDRA